MRFRRPIRRPRLARRLLRNELPNEDQNDLRQAHHLMENGEYQQAGAAFWHLAESAESRGLQGRAPFLFIQAGRAFSLAGNNKLGQQGLIHGFKLLANLKRWRALKDISNQVTQELKSFGNLEVAENLETWLRDNMPENFDFIPGRPVTSTISRPNLPAKCPYCGASASPTDVDWLDETTAACNYCGSIITG